MSFASISRKLLLLSIAFNCYATERTEGNWTVSADFLAWFPSEEVASIWVDVITIGDNTSTWNAIGFDFDWNYGFRIGTGYDLIYDEWDTTLDWTWFRTDAKHHIPPTPNSKISPEFDAAFLSKDQPLSLQAKWSLLLNMFDWELGRNYWVTPNLSLRPFLGLKGGWINQAIHAEYYDLIISSTPTDHSGSEHIRNNFWGAGPLGGVDTKWKILNSLTLFGDFSLATMWGTWSCGDVYKNTILKTTSVNTNNSALGALMFRGFMGFGWNKDFNAGKSHFAAKLGFETQFWVNQLRIATFQLQRLHNDLTLQGVTLNCQLDF